MPPRLKFSIRFVGVTPNYLLNISGPGALKSLQLKVEEVGVKIALSELMKRFGEREEIGR